VKALRSRPAVPVLGVSAALLWGLALIRPPLRAAPGLDPSWKLALTLAAEQKLRFGEQIVFTYGPLGFALTGFPSPALAVATALVQGVLAAATVAGVVTLLGGRGGVAGKLGFALAALAMSSMVAIDDVAAIGALALIARAARLPRTALAAGLAIGAIGLLGLLSKYTLGIETLAAGSVAWSVDAIRGPRRRRRIAAAAAIGCWAVTAVGLPAAFGFSPPALAAYLRGAAEISGGYSSAMAAAGPASQVAVAVVLGVAIAVLCAVLARDGRGGVAAAALVLLFLFWKHGFVRQDLHVLYFFAAAPAIAATVAIALRRGRARAFALGGTALALGALWWASLRVPDGPPQLFDARRVVAGLAFLTDPVGTEAPAGAAASAALAPDRLPADVSAEIGRSSVDVLPWETAIVAANGFRWAPLPVFQTYSAYTPALDGLDRDALVARGAAHVLYRYVAIDERAPFGDAPAMLVELACRYVPERARVETASGEPYLLLRRDPRARCTDAGAETVPARMGAAIPVPHAGAPSELVVASAVLRPSFGTRALTALWRAPPVDLEVRFDDGTEARYRAVVATLADGMIVSSVPSDDEEAARFFAGRRVRAVSTIAFVARPGAYALDRVVFRRLRRVR
jgi:hypothetical protein